MNPDENSDLICIRELELQVRVGVPEDERAKPQRLVLSLTIWPMSSFEEMRDRLERTVDYAAVARAVEKFTAGRADQLIETLAEKIAVYLLEAFPLRRVRIELRKFVLPNAGFVAVICERETRRA